MGEKGVYTKFNSTKLKENLLKILQFLEQSVSDRASKVVSKVVEKPVRKEKLKVLKGQVRTG